MASWSAFEQAEPELAARVRQLLDAGRHKTIATLRADGSPRISGIECEIQGGEPRFGSMPQSRKGTDLLRDGRFALHGPTSDPVEGHERDWPGEAKVAGRAVPADPPVSEEGQETPPGQHFVADISEVVLTHLDEDATHLVVEWWTPNRGVQTVERE